MIGFFAATRLFDCGCATSVGAELATAQQDKRHPRCCATADTQAAPSTPTPPPTWPHLPRLCSPRSQRNRREPHGLERLRKVMGCTWHARNSGNHVDG